MNRPDKETLRRVIRKMHRQNDCEKFIELASVFTGMLGKLNFHSVEFASDDPYHPFPLYMKHIHSVICEEEYLYILCYNGNLHILGTYERGHILIPLKEQLTLRNSSAGRADLGGIAYSQRAKMNCLYNENFIIPHKDKSIE